MSTETKGKIRAAAFRFMRIVLLFTLTKFALEATDIAGSPEVGVAIGSLLETVYRNFWPNDPIKKPEG